MDDPAGGNPPTAEESRRQHFRRRAGEIAHAALYWDLGIGLVVGAGCGYLTWLSPKVVDSVPPILLALLAIEVAIVSVVIAAHTLVTTLITDEYLKVVSDPRAKGLAGFSDPYLIVAYVSVAGAITTLVAVVVWPLLLEIPCPRIVQAVAFGVPAFLSTWSLVGAAQLVGLGSFHFIQRAAARRRSLDDMASDRPERSPDRQDQRTEDCPASAPRPD